MQDTEKEPNKVSEAQISFRLPKAQKNAFVGKVKGAGENITDVLIALLGVYLHDQGHPGLTSDTQAQRPVLSEKYQKHREEHEQLERVLNSGNPIVVAAIKSNLEAFALIRNAVTHSSKVFFPATSQQELEIYAMVERILHELGLPASIRQNFFAVIEETKRFTQQNEKKVKEISRKNA